MEPERRSPEFGNQPSPRKCPVVTLFTTAPEPTTPTSRYETTRPTTNGNSNTPIQGILQTLAKELNLRRVPMTFAQGPKRNRDQRNTRNARSRWTRPAGRRPQRPTCTPAPSIRPSRRPSCWPRTPTRRAARTDRMARHQIIRRRPAKNPVGAVTDDQQERQIDQNHRQRDHRRSGKRCLVRAVRPAANNERQPPDNSHAARCRRDRPASAAKPHTSDASSHCQ